MGWIKKKIDRIKSLGTVPFLMYASAKFLFGLGLAFIIAGLFPGVAYLVWGGIFIVISAIFSVPVIRNVFKKY